MLFCNYETYCLYYPDDKDAESSAEALIGRASSLIDRETMGRARKLLAVLDPSDETAQALKHACCMVAHALYVQDDVSRKTANGTVTYANTDGYMESYADAGTQYGSVSTSVRSALEQCLGADPFGLLYRGL